MRIAYVVGSFPALSETFILDQIAGMVSLGHAVHIFSSRSPRRSIDRLETDELQLISKTTYLRPAASRFKIATGFVSALARSPRAAFDVLSGTEGSWKTKALNLCHVQPYVRMNDDEYDIVHCQYGPLGNRFSFTKRSGNSRLVVSFRGHDFSRLPKRFGADMYVRLFDKVDAVTAVSDDAKSKVIGLGCPPEKIVTHHSGTDTSRFSFDPRTLAPEEPLRLVTVARLTEKKGIEYAISAVAKLIGRIDRPVQYTIVGDGELRTHLEGVAESLSISRCVEFVGAQPHGKVVDFLHEAHVFVLPSLTAADGSEEGIPGTLREAMATGMPVVSTFHAGIPELLDDGQSGYLVPERDPEALAERLALLATHPETWFQMGKAGRQRIEERFDSPTLNARLESLYKHVMDGGVPSEFDAQTQISPSPSIV